MNDEPYFNGGFYIALDGAPLPDYNAAIAYNTALVSNPYSAFYNPESYLYNAGFDVSNTPAIESPQEVLDQGHAGEGDTSGGWNWLMPIFGTAIKTGGEILSTKVMTQVQLAEIEAKGRLQLAQQDSAQRLLAAQNKYTTKPTTQDEGLSTGTMLALGAAALAGAFLLTR